LGGAIAGQPSSKSAMIERIARRRPPS
jgi:hypothetical protein